MRVVSSGQFLPPRTVTADQVDERIGLAPGWTRRHTGVLTRYHVDEETAAEMGAAALTDALKASGWSTPLPDLLICASGTPQQPIPCTAALVAREMAWSGIPCFDVNSTCLSFVAALQVAGGLFAAGSYRRIAIVSTEIGSKGLDWGQPESAGLMGDGAAAVLVEFEPHGTSSLLGTMLETWPEGAPLTEIRGGGSRLPSTEYRAAENRKDFLFHMDGPGVFRLTAEKMGAFLERLIGSEGRRWDGIDWVIPHQASLPAIRRMRRRLGIPPEKMVETVQDQGNVIAASIPLALHGIIASGQVERGQTVLLVGTSAGFSLGAALLRY